VSTFTTGLLSVDKWFGANALDEQNAGRVRTHLCVSDNGDIVAFFALKHIIVSLEGTSSRLRQSGDANGQATGLLLAQMGVRSNLQGNGAGKQVVQQVFVVAATVLAQASFQLLVVDAESERLVPYYEQFGFRRLPNDRRLVMKMSAVHKLVSTC